MSAPVNPALLRGTALIKQLNEQLIEALNENDRLQEMVTLLEERQAPGDRMHTMWANRKLGCIFCGQRSTGIARESTKRFFSPVCDSLAVHNKEWVEHFESYASGEAAQ